MPRRGRGGSVIVTDEHTQRDIFLPLIVCVLEREAPRSPGPLSARQSQDTVTAGLRRRVTREPPAASCPLFPLVVALTPKESVIFFFLPEIALFY